MGKPTTTAATDGLKRDGLAMERHVYKRLSTDEGDVNQYLASNIRCKVCKVWIHVAGYLPGVGGKDGMRRLSLTGA